MTKIAVGAIVVLVFSGSVAAHHNPRLFDNDHGDHGGTYERGAHTFFWMPDEKRFGELKVCLWQHPDGAKTCKLFRVHRVPAASHRPWGVDFRTAKHFELSRGKWDLRFRHAGEPLSPVLGFHRR